MKSSTCSSVFLVLFIFVCMNECAVGLNFEVTYQGGFLGGDLATQRREAFAAALAIYEGQLGGTVPVKIRAEFRSFNEPQGSLSLAVSDSANASANLSGLPLRGVWFPAAVASQLTGVSLPASSGNPKNIGYHMYCEFNSDIDGLDGPGGKWAFHYQSTPLPKQRFDFVRTALHEIGHGLGFQVVPQYWLQSPYDFPAGMPCIYSWWLRSRDNYYPGYFVELSRVARDGAMTSRNMWWCGPNIVALGMYGLANHNGINSYNEVEIYAPNNLAKGKSLDHWGLSLPVSQTEMEPPYNLLMRQSAAAADLLVTQSRDIDITRQALLDICWTFKDVSVTPSRLRFQRSSSKAMGDAQTIVLANNGPNLTITALTLVGPHLTDFSFSAPTLPYSIPTLGSMTIPISFEPSDPGFKKASLHIEWSCNGTYSSDVPLTGCATAVDSDEDGISDYDETRDLDPIMPGVQNPFDDALADSTGGTGHIGSDWVPTVLTIGMAMAC